MYLGEDYQAFEQGIILMMWIDHICLFIRLIACFQHEPNPPVGAGVTLTGNPFGIKIDGT